MGYSTSLSWLLVRNKKIIVIANGQNIITFIKKINIINKKNIYVIIRAYNINNRENYINQIAKYCHKLNIKFSIANDIKLVKKYNADGIHLPEYQINNIRNIKKNFPKLIITISAHDISVVNKLQKIKPNMIIFSPIFNSFSDNKVKKGKGVLTLNRITSLSNIGICALGGINNNNIKQLYRLKLDAVAGISLFAINHFK